MKNYIEYAVQKTVDLCIIPSPTGFTRKIEELVFGEFAGLGFNPVFTNKRSILVDLGGEGNGLVIAAHVDTLGAMVRSIKPNGRLRLSKIGSYAINNIEHENCTIHTRSGKEYTGTIQLEKSAAHIYSSMVISEIKRDETSVEVVIDEKVKSKEDVKKLDINTGDFVSFDPKTVYTKSGFIKSLHLDDKAGCGILMSLAKYIKENNIELDRKIYLLFTTYEEVGHGASAGIPDDVEEMISIDLGPVGEDLETDEYKVSICAMDKSGGPYDFDVTNKLINLANEHALNFAVDIYPVYASDSDSALFAGYDIKHGLIGPGVSASHGYERTHREAIENTLILLKEYIMK